MTRSFVILVVALALSLIGAGVWAQNRPVPGPITTTPRGIPLTVAPEVLSGENLGVRLTGAVDQYGQVQGALVVNINGHWVDVVLPQESPRK
jgi:hypothetical protein